MSGKLVIITMIVFSAGGFCFAQTGQPPADYKPSSLNITGQQYPRLEPIKSVVATFRENGLKVEFATFPVAHEWQVWRKSLHDFASRLFK